MSARNSRRTSPRTVAERLRSMPDEEIDYSDIPPLDDEFFRTAELLMPRAKTAVSLRLDTDVLEWMKAKGPGYQSRINAVLRAYVEAERRRSGRRP
jgi:uncharacterized protein (DUF4415 family)